MFTKLKKKITELTTPWQLHALCVWIVLTDKLNYTTEPTYLTEITDLSGLLNWLT